MICSNSSSIFEFEEFSGAESFRPPILAASASASSFLTSVLFTPSYSSSSLSPIEEIDLSKIAKKRFRSMKLPSSIRKMKNKEGPNDPVWTMT